MYTLTSDMVARWLQPNFYIVGIWPFGLEGLWLCYATPQNLIQFCQLATLTSETRDAFPVEGEGGVEEDLTGGDGGARWLPPMPIPGLPAELLFGSIPVAIWSFLTSMKETDLPRFRGGGRRCERGK